MNPMLISALLPMAQKLFQGGKLDGMLGGVGGSGGADLLKSLLGDAEERPDAQLFAVIGLLADHVPTDEGKAEGFRVAIIQVLNGLAALKRLVNQ